MKIKNLKNKFLATALAFTLAASALTSTAEASEVTPEPTLKVKKVLNMPEEGVTTPSETFTFTFTKVGKNGGNVTEGMPELGSKTVEFNSDMKDDNDENTDGRQVILSTGDFLEGINFEESGQFTYTVKETEGSTNDMIYSQAQYTVSIVVEKKGEEYVVTSIQVKKDKNDDGSDGQGGKVEIVPGGDKTNDGNFKFENNYDPIGGNNENPGKDPEDKDKSGLQVEKKIDVAEGETANKDEAFEFTLKVTKPVGTHSDKKATFVVVSGGNIVETKEVEYGSDISVDLKDGDKIVFKEILLGSKVSVKETKSGNYTPDVSGSVNGVTADKASIEAGMVVGDNESGNSVLFNNKKMTAVGVLVNNLPFIALVGLALVGIFFFVKNRKEDQVLA